MNCRIIASKYQYRLNDWRQQKRGVIVLTSVAFQGIFSHSYSPIKTDTKKQDSIGAELSHHGAASIGVVDTSVTVISVGKRTVDRLARVQVVAGAKREPHLSVNGQVSRSLVCAGRRGVISGARIESPGAIPPDTKTQCKFPGSYSHSRCWCLHRGREASNPDHRRSPACSPREKSRPSGFSHWLANTHPPKRLH